MPQTRTVHPRVAEMLASGQLTLPDDVDPADVTYMRFDAPPPAAPSAPEPGQLTIPACLLNRDFAQALDDEGGIRAFNERLHASGILHTTLVPTPVYVHCGRECARCDEVFCVTEDIPTS